MGHAVAAGKRNGHNAWSGGLCCVLYVLLNAYSDTDSVSSKHALELLFGAPPRWVLIGPSQSGTEHSDEVTVGPREIRRISRSISGV